MRGLASVVLVATLAACSHDEVRLDASTVDGAVDAPVLRLDAPGEVVTTIRVVYAGLPGEITFRGSGGPLSWTDDVAATGRDGDVWILETTAVTTPIEWKPRLGDAWARGPNYHLDPGDTIEVAPRFLSGGGTLGTFEDDFVATPGGGPRPVTIYLPPGYAENTAARWPVIYAQDGQNLFDPTLAFGGVEWEVDETLDAAADTGRCPDGTACAADDDCGGARCDTFRGAIVVGIDNTGARIDEYTPSIDASVGDGGDADLYLTAIGDDLRPRIEAAFRTRSGAAHTGILGSSLGGLLAAHASVTRASDFGLVGAMSPSTWWDDRMILDEVATITTPRPLRVYVDSGDSGPSMDGVTDTAALAAAYRTLGYVEGSSLHHVVAPGHAHSESYWAERLPAALAFLLGPREEHITP